MRQIVAFIFLLVIGFAFWGCHKNKSDDSNIFYGTWIKGNRTGDTLVFYQKNGKNVLSFNMSFNPLFFAPSDAEYFYKNGKLSYRYINYPDASFNIESFKWKQVGKEFEIRGIELYSFMSASNVYFTFQKIQ
jgi:hypothetical protein